MSPDPFPGWSGDPLVMEAPITGLTPAFSVGLDVLTLLASAVVLVGCAGRGWRPRGWELACYWIGAMVVAYYSARADSTLMDIVLGCQWLAGFGAALACVQACRDARLRRLVLAGLVGVGVIVALKGGFQVFVEHPAMYKDFVLNKSRVLGAQGWTEGSPMALAYERRVSQADATGWFGLSNVFSTVMAGAMVLCAGMGLMGLAGPMGRMGRGKAAALLGAAVVFGAGLWLSHSKGGMAAGAMGLGLLGVLWVVSRTKWRVSWRVAGCVAVLLPFAALVAVMVRGAVGERLSELSLYFRWFYLQGAARIAAESPLLGVGPDGFKDAYMRMKPAISPEDVSSPHSWFVDLIATLGVGGWAWGVWLLTAMYRGGRAVAFTADAKAEEAEEFAGSLRDEVRGLLVLFGLVTAAGALFEHRIAVVDGTILRVVSLVGAVAVGGVVCGALRGEGKKAHSDEDMAMARRGVMAPVIAAVVAVVTHCQIEMTGITAGAGLWVLLLVAMGAGAGMRGVAARRASSGTLRGRIGPAALVCASVIPIVVVAKLVRWELHIREATRIVAPVPEFADRIAAIAEGRDYKGDSLRLVAREMSIVLGQAVPDTLRGVEAGLSQLRGRAIELAEAELMRARDAGPRDFQTARAASRLGLIIALNQSRPELRRVSAREAEGVVLSHMKATGESVSGWAWLGTMRRSVFDGTKDVVDGRGAVEAFGKAAALAPYEPLYRVEAARLEAAMGNGAEAARWAGEALRLSEQMRLDPVRQLAGKELEEVRGLAGGL